MKDLYVDDLAEETGKLFEFWALNHMDVDQMATRYMNSNLRENADKRYAKFCTHSWDDMARQFEDVKGTEDYDFVLCNWLGMFYTYLQRQTGKSSKELIRQFPFATMYIKSNVLHDLDLELAVKKIGAV